MSHTNLDLLNLAKSPIPMEYDWNLDNLQTFLDALSVMEMSCIAQETNAVTCVKSRLIGQSRDLITTESSITPKEIHSHKILKVKLSSFIQQIDNASTTKQQKSSYAQVVIVST